MQRFNALVASKGEKGLELSWKELGEADLMDGNVTVRVSHSTLNYKDALALTGKAPIVRRWPMIRQRKRSTRSSRRPSNWVV